jgi:hypothetical protein
VFHRKLLPGTVIIENGDMNIKEVKADRLNENLKYSVAYSSKTGKVPI